MGRNVSIIYQGLVATQLSSKYTQLLSKDSSGYSEFTSYKEDGLHQSAHSSVGFRWLYTSQTGSTADVNACSNNELVDDENHKNEARFTFSQIHQYRQYVIIHVYCMVMAKFSKTKKNSMAVTDFMEGSLVSYEIGDPRVLYRKLKTQVPYFI